MAEPKARGRAAVIRPIVLVVVLGTIAFFVWRSATRKEGYSGGDVVTTGTIEAEHVDLSFKVGGRLAEVPVMEGARVEPGQLIGRLDIQDFDVQVSTARAAVESAHAAMAQARANRDKAVRDLARQRELIQSDATTQQQLDAAQSAARVAAAQVQAAAAQAHQAESALAQAQLTRSYAVVRSPQAGQVTEKIHHPGEMITVGTPVVTISDLDTLKVHAAVDETRVGAVRPGDSVSVRVYTFDKKTFPGTVTDVSPAGDFATRKDWGAQRRDIRTFDVTARVPNPEGLLKDGMTAEVTIHVEGASTNPRGPAPVAERTR